MRIFHPGDIDTTYPSEEVILDESEGIPQTGFVPDNRGEKNPAWKGGISKDPEHLRMKFREYNERYKERKREKYYANREERCRIERERYHARKRK